MCYLQDVVNYDAGCQLRRYIIFYEAQLYLLFVSIMYVVLHICKFNL